MSVGVQVVGLRVGAKVVRVGVEVAGCLEKGWGVEGDNVGEFVVGAQVGCSVGEGVSGLEVGEQLGVREGDGDGAWEFGD
mmetsp:Transcript_3624/g.6720  ORF Transcript_3624/g.6720 Transcript_3624/m.6720 type:complete len:80 (-) Transcript_3624:125-364(-)